MITNRKFIFNTRSILIFTLIVSINNSCRKKIIETQTVIEIVQTMTLPVKGNVKHFAFPSQNVGFAAIDGGKLYMTTDGGNSWQETSIIDCNGVEFFDTQHGICIDQNTVKYTEDGGLNWTIKSYADYIGKTIDGICVAVDGYSDSCNVKVSNDNGNTFIEAGSIKINGYLKNVSISGTSVFAIGEDAFYYDALYGMKIPTYEDVKIKFDNNISSEQPTGVYFFNNVGAVAGGRGFIGDFSTGNTCYRSHYGHARDFFNITGYNDVMIAFGEKTLVSNLGRTEDVPWVDVLDNKGNGFKQTFINVKFEDENTLYLGTSEGTLLKAKL